MLNSSDIKKKNIIYNVLNTLHAFPDQIQLTKIHYMTFTNHKTSRRFQKGKTPTKRPHEDNDDLELGPKGKKELQ